MYISRTEIEKVMELFEKADDIYDEFDKARGKGTALIVGIGDIPLIKEIPGYSEALENILVYLMSLGYEKLLDLAALMWYGGWKPLGEYSFCWHRKDLKQYFSESAEEMAYYIFCKNKVVCYWLRTALQMLDKYGVSVREV